MTDYVALVTAQIERAQNRAVLIQGMAKLIALLPAEWASPACTVNLMPELISAYLPTTRVVICYYYPDPPNLVTRPHYCVQFFGHMVTRNTPEEVADYIRGLPAPAQ